MCGPIFLIHVSHFSRASLLEQQKYRQILGAYIIFPPILKLFKKNKKIKKQFSLEQTHLIDFISKLSFFRTYFLSLYVSV